MFVINFRSFIVMFIVALTGSACSNFLTSEAEGHTDAEGFILEDENGNEIYREFEGATTGSISLIIGQELEVLVHFLDHDGNEIEHEEEDDDHDHDHDHDEESELKITGNDATIATVEIEGDEGLHINAISAGSTSFTLQLMHGDHADYTSTNSIPITVTDSTMFSCTTVCLKSCCSSTIYASR